jgi:hypothetical protein
MLCAGAAAGSLLSVPAGRGKPLKEHASEVTSKRVMATNVFFIFHSPLRCTLSPGGYFS